MARPTKPPSALAVRWHRHHRIVYVLLVVTTVLTAVFVSFGLAVVPFLALLTLATFAGGGPTDNGRTRATSSVPGSRTGV